MPPSISPVVIRPANPGDAHALGRLGALMVRTHHDFDPQRFVPAGPGTERGYGSWLASQTNEPDVVVLVAEHEGEVVGYAYAGLEGHDYMALRGPAGALYDVIVNPAHRGGGVGRQLLDAAIAALKGKGAPRIVLSTAQRNLAAQRLFERAGFRRTMIEMTKELEPESDAGESRLPPRSAVGD